MAQDVQSNDVEDHAGCSWTVVYSHLSKVYNELYDKGGLKPNVQAMRVMPSMPMNVAYGAMHLGIRKLRLYIYVG